MSEGNCPRCPSGAVYATNVYDNTRHLPVSEGEALGVRAVVRERVSVRTLVCSGCGYLETYVVDHDFLKKIRSSNAWVKA
jgi:hypothetical protein